MAGNIFGAVFFGHKIVKQTLMAGMRTGWVPMIRTSERVLEDRGRSPRGAIPISVTTLFNEIQFIAQNFQYIPLILRHLCLPWGAQAREFAPILATILVDCERAGCDTAH